MKNFGILFSGFFCLAALLILGDSVGAQSLQPPSKTLSHTFLDGLRWGFISVLQPCLYAMFPVTVSFFLKHSQSRMQGIKNATLYSFSIIAIFTILGLFLTIIFGRDTLYQIS